MRVRTEEQIRAYVERQLDELIRARPDWHSFVSTEVPGTPLVWQVSRRWNQGPRSWYTVQADLAREEILIWYGNHQVGAPGTIYWIMRPAVHVAFADLQPRDDPLGLPYGLKDILDFMISSLDLPGVAMKFQENAESLT